jgi:dihydrofolate synthase/folylpolyglutamate synthase
MTYPDAIQFLYGLRMFGTKFGLENTRQLAALAGNPHDRLRFIHVAGTNGKGSTCAMLESIYRASGLRVGLFTSPHLVSFAERIQVNRRMISEADVVRLVEEMQPLLKQFPTDGHPTFFEVVVVMALRYFIEQKCDLVIWETGLGGRLDATNIVTPLAAVITNIQFDHERWLGRTLSSIAFEKAGIIKPGVPVITGATEPEALAVIQDAARARNSPLTLIGPDHTRLAPLDQTELPLLGWHQRLNAAVALATVQSVQGALPVTERQMRDGLARVHWPGRMQLLELPGSPASRDAGPTPRRFLLDGAHNPGGVATLRAVLGEHFPGLRPAIILGILEDKDWHSMCEILVPVAARLLVVRVASERALGADLLAAACRKANPGVPIRACGSLSEALEGVAEEPFVVIAGSLYLIGEAMELLNILRCPDADEKGLNDWSAAGRNP